MEIKRIFDEIRENTQEVIDHDSPLGKSLWKAFLDIHPADIADFLSDIDRERCKQIFLRLPKHLRLEVFRELSDAMKVHILAFMNDHDKVDAFHILPIDELTDLFDLFSDEELKIYLNLLHQQAREKVLSLLQFDPESAGGIMSTDVITLVADFTVEKSIKLLQRLSPSKDIHQQLYVVNRYHQLEGHINLEDLVLQKPHERIGSFMHKNELVARAQEDREAIAKKMVHYSLMTVPVVDDENHFLGIISSETLVDVIVEEATEDVQKMSALAPMKYPYFESSFTQLFIERCPILIGLLIAQSFSSSILRAYETTLSLFLLSLVPMLTSTGGNTSSQTSAMVIQGLATGEISQANVFKFLRRELLMSLLLAGVLGITSFIRVYWLGGADIMQSFTASISISFIVITSVMLGSSIPLIFKRLNIDPAFSAGPVLATLMDILGVMIYCSIISWILG